MRLIGYNRVSLEEQAKFGHSLEIQPLQHGQWCRAMGHTLVDVVSDPGVSAGKVRFEDRPGGQEICRRLLAGEADGVVVVRFDRAFRIAVDGLLSAEWFLSKGFSFLSIEQPVDISTDFGWYVFGQMCLQAELERRTIVRRAVETSAGLRDQGKPFGATPFGCVRIGAQIFRDPAQWAVREEIVALKTGGLSYRGVEKVLRGRGLRAPEGGKLWHASTLRKICVTHHDLQHIPLLGGTTDTGVSHG